MGTVSKNKILTPLSIAELTGASLRWVYRQLRNGTIPSRRIGKKFFVSEEAFLKYLAGNNQAKTDYLRKKEVNNGK
jgi:excisionase family DNA binding protein